MKIAMLAPFEDYYRNHKKILRVYMVLGGRCLKIRDVCLEFEPYFKVHNLVSGHYKNIKLGQMTNLQHDLLRDGVRLSIG